MAAREYAGNKVVVSFDARRCIHAAECVGGAPAVFDPDAKPWIRPDNGDPQAIAAVVRRCPTGALTMRFVDGSAAEQPDAAASATLVADGPIYLRGRVLIPGGAHAAMAEYTRVALCRCGASGNKPFCDHSHTKAGFKDSGCCASPPAAGTAQPDAALTLNPIANGPLMVEGVVEFRTADGGRFVSEQKTWLCRCGASRNKPFCDGSHKKIGFTA